MMKNIKFVALAALVVGLTLVPTPKVSNADVGVCDPQRSLLCQGLNEWWDFEETTSGIRVGSYRNSVLYQMDGYNNSYSATHMVGSNSLSLAGNGYGLRIPRYGDLGSNFTLAAWIRQSSQTTDQDIISQARAEETYPTSGVYTAAGTRFFIKSADHKITFWSYEAETDGSAGATFATVLSANTWYLVVIKVSPFGPYGKAQACVSLNGGAFSCGTMNYNHRNSSEDLLLFQNWNGLVDGLGIWNRPFSQNDAANLYRNGSPLPFPFY